MRVALPGIFAMHKMDVPLLRMRNCQGNMNNKIIRHTSILCILYVHFRGTFGWWLLVGAIAGAGAVADVVICKSSFTKDREHPITIPALLYAKYLSEFYALWVTYIFMILFSMLLQG